MFTECSVCKISLQNNDWRSHVAGKRHIGNLKRMKSNEVEQSPVIKRFQLTRSGELIQVEKDAVQVKTETVEVQKKNIKGEQPKIIEGAQAKIIDKVQPDKTTPANNQRTEPKKMGKRKLAKEKTQRDSKTDVPDVVVDKTRPFLEQVDDFITQISQTEVERMNIRKVLEDVSFTFNRVMPNVLPLLFGSQLSGLAMRTSDIDVYLCNPAGGDEDPDFIKRQGRIIYRSRLFTDIIHVTRARVPVIKAKHKRTGIELDISATSGQAVANSHLLRFLLSYDPRVRRLMMLIGYWAKKCQLISTCKFSRYSINLLIIFYLQNLEFPILPPLCTLVHGVPGKTWPFLTNCDQNLLKNQNTQELHQLFLGFFEFYSDFPFKKYVISPYLGVKIPSSEMDQPEVLDTMTYYKTYLQLGGEKLSHRLVCIQDPLELNYNNGRSVRENTLSDFEVCCKKIIELKNIELSDWLYKIVSGEYAPVYKTPVSKEPTTMLFFETQSGWTDKFRSEFTKAVSVLGMTLGSKQPNLDDPKKTKLNSDCLQFIIESSRMPFIAKFRILAGLLKNNEMNLETFGEVFLTHLESLPLNNKFNFVSQCFVSLVKPNLISVKFINLGDPISFNKTIIPLKKNLALLMGLKGPICGESQPENIATPKIDTNCTESGDKKSTESLSAIKPKVKIQNQTVKTPNAPVEIES